MTGYDIIGDVHGCATELVELLEQLDYRIDSTSGSFQHETRQAIFVGDLVDRGPSQLDVLRIVKAMVDAGSARIVMGNHEFNALAFGTEDPVKPNTYLRDHSDKNIRQHEAFLEQLTIEERVQYLEWFWTIPLWLDLGDLRVVHACWHQPSIDLIERTLGGDTLTTIDQLAEAAGESKDPDSLYRAVENVLKGPELDLKEYDCPPFMDPDGNVREEARIRWWKSGAKTVVELAEVPGNSRTPDGAPYGNLPAKQVNERDRSFSYGDPVPVFYGHYWRTDVPLEHEDWTERTACVDFSAVKGGTMVAYRWSGEAQIDWRNYHPHGADLIEPTPSN